MLKSFLFTTAIACIAAPLSAQAVAPSVRVSYADLALQTPAGRATLDRRIGAAVRRVCVTGTKQLDEAMAERRCVRETSHGARKLADAATARAEGVLLANR